jgi:glutamate-1-semialdehyde 2,1-aminomutase
MRRPLEQSRAHYQRALERIPLGVSSNFRAWGDRTIYVERARGARLWDIDGNEYIDYRLGYGPVILGHADPRVDAAARKAIELGGTTALSTQREAAVAERIAGMMPAAELVRFANSGTEAVMASLRLARAYTGKQGHVMVEGGFHGLFDAVLWEIRFEDLGSSEQLELKTYGAGVPEVLRELVHIVPLNDADRLEDVLRRHADEIAAMIVEPILGNAGSIPADPQYLRDVRELCDRYEVVLIVDEVKTGFRVGRGGVQELMGVQADLCTFAKALGNGYPISALAGREEIMRRIGGPGGIAQGGTYAAHPVPLAAAEKTLEILDETDALESIAAYGRRLQKGISEILERRGIAHVWVGHPSMAGLFLTETPPRNYRDWADADCELYDAMAAELNDLGILCEPDSREPWFLCEAHDDACLGETLERVEIALDQALEKRRPSRGREAIQAGERTAEPAVAAALDQPISASTPRL